MDYFLQSQSTVDSGSVVCAVANLLLQECILELLCVELDSELVCTHSGSSEEHRVFDEVRR